MAWNASAGALERHRGYASAALRVAVDWDPSRTGAPEASCRAELDVAGSVRAIPVGGSASVRVLRNGDWVHLDVRSGAGTKVLEASFERGRLAYCASSVPEAAGLPGGSYDSPTGILDLYDPPAPQ